ETQQLGLELTALNLTAMASGAGSTCVKKTMGSGSGAGYSPISYFANCPYLEGILVSLCVAALLIWIMCSLLTYIPTLASNLTGYRQSGFGVFGRATDSRLGVWPGRGVGSVGTWQGNGDGSGQGWREGGS